MSDDADQPRGRQEGAGVPHKVVVLPVARLPRQPMAVGVGRVRGRGGIRGRPAVRL